MTRQAQLQARVFLLSPTLSYWRGSYQLSRQKAGVTINGEAVDGNSVTVPHSVLLGKASPVDGSGKPWKSRLQGIESLHTAIVNKYSIAFPIRGVRIVPKASGAAFFAEMIGPTVGALRAAIKADTSTPDEINTAKTRLELTMSQAGEFGVKETTPVFDPLAERQSAAYELWAAAIEFCNSLPTIFEQIQRTVDPVVWADTSKRIPQTPRAMWAKFGMDLLPIEIAGGEPQELTTADMQQYGDVLRSACTRKVEEAIEAMVAEPRAQLAAAVTDLQELLARDGRVTTKSFNPIRAAIEKIRAFEFVADASLLAKIDTMQQQLTGAVPSALTAASSVSNGLMAVLDAVKTEALDEARAATAITNFGHHRRVLDLS